MQPSIKFDHDLVIFDLETTGLSKTKDCIVQIAGIRYTPSKETSSLGRISANDAVGKINTRVNPLMPIQEGASEVHGIHDEDVSDKPTFRQLAPKLFKFFDGCYWGGYNITGFDYWILMRQFKACAYIPKVHGLIDAFNIYKEFYVHTLTGAYRTYCKQELQGAHDAMTDVLATREVLFTQFLNHDEISGSAKALSKRYQKDPDLDMQGQLQKDERGILSFTFGKHKGTDILAVPADYLRWLSTKQVLNPDTQALVSKYMDYNRSIL